MNKTTNLILAQIITFGMIDYILDAISLTTEQKMTLKERRQIKESLLGAINLNLTTKLLDQPRIGKKTAAMVSQLNPEMTFDQILEILTQDLNQDKNPLDIDLSKLLIQASRVTLIKFTEKTIPDSKKLISVIKEIMA